MCCGGGVQSTNTLPTINFLVSLIDVLPPRNLLVLLTPYSPITPLTLPTPTHQAFHPTSTHPSIHSSTPPNLPYLLFHPTQPFNAHPPPIHRSLEHRGPTCLCQTPCLRQPSSSRLPQVPSPTRGPERGGGEEEGR